MAPKQLTKDETELLEGITKGYARWVIDEWKNVVNSATLTTEELALLDQTESAA